METQTTEPSKVEYSEIVDTLIQLSDVRLEQIDEEIYRIELQTPKEIVKELEQLQRTLQFYKENLNNPDYIITLSEIRKTTETYDKTVDGLYIAGKNVDNLEDQIDMLKCEATAVYEQKEAGEAYLLTIK